ncbi:MAG: hypothetical protein VB124_04510 [Burkholderia sp.]
MSENTDIHSRLRQLRQGRPWQLLMVGEGIDQLNSEAHEALARILDLFPAVSHLLVQTIAGGCRVSRDFPSGYIDEVDQRLAGIFQGNPAVTGITFPKTSTRPGHTATPDDPHWSAEGKASTGILAALTRGEITADEAVAQLKQLAGGDGTLIPNRLTAETIAKSERGEDLHHAKNAEDLFRKLDI